MWETEYKTNSSPTKNSPRTPMFTRRVRLLFCVLFLNVKPLFLPVGADLYTSACLLCLLGCMVVFDVFAEEGLIVFSVMPSFGRLVVVVFGLVYGVK